MVEHRQTKQADGARSRWIAATIAVLVAVMLLGGGYRLVQFEMTSRNVRETLDGMAGQASGAQVAALGREVAPWLGSRLVPVRAASLALDVELSAEKPDTMKAEALLAGLLASKPTHASGWQSAADLKTVNGAAIEAALPFWRLSYTLGPNEGLVMLQRAMFGIENWKALGEPDRDKVIHDVVAALTYDFDSYQYTLFMQVLGAMDPAARAQLVTAVRARGPAAEKALQRMRVN